MRIERLHLAIVRCTLAGLVLSLAGCGARTQLGGTASGIVNGATDLGVAIDLSSLVTDLSQNSGSNADLAFDPCGVGANSCAGDATCTRLARK